ncbi:MerR family transcriptional regulator [Enterococcus hulanensis]|uniref:MerR family transcriptional regulator n=1 Tax=Enterococcus hulanensis TaxID=2559929 RepID=UPI00288F29D1|nr:MerR family transcriptional regulator [Enterococcus hulanensis]MDT2659208.1 MerR family transcriptional regulator [Enterococcus hulanensis]
MKIGEISKRTNIPISTIRFYDSQQLIPPAYMRRLENQQRDFTEDAIPFLIKIHNVIKAGVLIEELKSLVNPDPTPEVIQQQVRLIKQNIELITEKQGNLQEAKSFLSSLLNERD